jgi:hypothetical protein
MNTSNNPFYAPCIVDQKDLNEAMIVAISEVAQCNAHHCAELFGMPLKLAERFARMAQQDVQSVGALDPLQDLATTPSALWRVVMSAQDVACMQKKPQPMAKFYLEPYRHIVAKLNEQVILTLLRYTAHPATAALVSGLGNLALIQALATASCSTLLQSAKNMGRPLVELTINELFIDRIFSSHQGTPVKAALRGLMARVMCTWQDFSELTESIDDELRSVSPERLRKIGRPTAVFLPQGEADTIAQLIAHGVSTKTILTFTRSEINSSQVRKLRLVADSQPAAADAFEPSRFQDSNAAVWGSATRRLIVTSIFAHQRILVSLGVNPHAAFVQAYGHYNVHYKDHSNHMSLARLISAVYMPLRGGQVHLAHCGLCGTMHLLHDGYHNAVDCPVCALAKFKRLARRSVDRCDVLALKTKLKAVVPLSPLPSPHMFELNACNAAAHQLSAVA